MISAFAFEFNYICALLLGQSFLLLGHLICDLHLNELLFMQAIQGRYGNQDY